jgi:hypothetical protein
MAQPISAQTYSHFRGVDLSIPLELRTPDIAERMQNATFLRSGAVATRKGWKYASKVAFALGYGMYVRNEDGVSVKSKHIVTIKLKEIVLGTFLISKAQNLTTPSIVRANFLVDAATNTYKFEIIEDDLQVLLYDTGVGFDESTPIKLSDLETAIENISADYTATITGDDVEASLLPKLVNVSFTGTDPKELIINYEYALDLREPAGSENQFTAVHTERHSSTFKNCTFLNHHDVLLIASEQTELRKWDGVICHKAGMPPATITSITPTGSDSLTAKWNYKIRYAHLDNKNNYIPGRLSSFTEVELENNASANLVIPTIQAASGFATDQAIINGAQGPVNTITVDSGHNINEGDKVALIDTATNANFATFRTVSAVTATTITIEGDAVTVADDSVISNSLVIEIYRTKNLGSLLYEVASIPNNSDAASITYVDTTVDDNIGALFFEPQREPDAPPKGGVIIGYQGIPVITRNPDEPNKIYWGEPLFPEGFPIDQNSELIYSPSGGSIVSIFPTPVELLISFESSISRLIGILLNDVFEIRPVANSVGCTNHDTFKLLENGLITWLSLQGPMQMVPGGEPSPLGQSIEAIFTDQKLSDQNVYRLEKAISVDIPTDRVLLFYLPTESTIGGERFANTFSEVWALNYQSQNNPRWLGPWTNVNMIGGAIYDDREVTFVSRRFDSEESAVTSYTGKFLNRGDNYDHVDHTLPISFEWLPGFETFGDEDTKKIYEYLKVNSNEIQSKQGFTLNMYFEKNFLRNVSHVQGLQLQIGAGGGLGWGFAPWGFFPWGMPTPASFTRKIPIPNEALALRPVFRHSKVYERPIITSFRIKILPEYRPGLGR